MLLKKVDGKALPGASGLAAFSLLWYLAALLVILLHRPISIFLLLLGLHVANLQ
jgi:hypothetical protein